MEGILGKDTRMVQPPLSMDRPEKPPLYHKTRSVDIHDRRPLEQALVAEGVHRDVDFANLASAEKEIPDREDTAVTYSPTTPTKRHFDHDQKSSPSEHTSSPKRDLHAHPQDHRPVHAATAPIPFDHHGKGQAHDPLSDHLYLALGPGGSSAPPSPPAVSESPPAADTNIYETAYHQELERIRAEQGRSATLFLNRRVEGREDYRNDEGLVKGDGAHFEDSKPKTGFAKVLEQARMKAAKGDKPDTDKSEADGNEQTSFAKVLEQTRTKAAKGDKPDTDKSENDGNEQTSSAT